MERFRQITRKALNFVFLAATPMMIYFILFAKQGIFLLSGENYAGSIVPMQWIMPTLLFIGLSNVLGIQILVPLGRERVVLWSIIAGAVVDVRCSFPCTVLPVLLPPLPQRNWWCWRFSLLFWAGKPALASERFAIGNC